MKFFIKIADFANSKKKVPNMRHKGFFLYEMGLIDLDLTRLKLSSRQNLVNQSNSSFDTQKLLCVTFFSKIYSLRDILKSQC